MSNYLLKNAFLLQPEADSPVLRNILLQNGIVTDIFPPQSTPDSLPANCQEEDLSGHYVTPAFIDISVTITSPETIETTQQSAYIGGIAHFASQQEASSAKSDYTFIPPLSQCLNLPSCQNCYEDMTTATTPLADRLNFFNAAYDLGARLHLTSQEASFQDTNIATSSALATKLGLKNAPALTETLKIEQDLRLAELSNAKIHLKTVTTSEAVTAIRRAKERGVDVTCDTAPAYFLMNEIDISHLDTNTKFMPPLREDTDREAICQALADGTIDAICSNHAPIPFNETGKDTYFEQAQAGAVGVETLFALSLSLVHQGILSLPALLSKISTSPARILGKETPEIHIGTPANLVIFDKDLLWRVNAKEFKTICQNTPFHKKPLIGRILSTYIKGQKVYSLA